MLNKSIFAIFGLSLVLAVAISSCKEAVETTNPFSQPALEVEEIYRPLVHHFGSTGCSGCGRWGMPLVHRIADEMGDTAMPFITHFKYDDPFITASSQALEDAFLDARYSPQLWFNSEDITFDIINQGLNNSVEEVKRRVRDSLQNTAKAYLGFEASRKENGRYTGSLAVKNNRTDSATYYVEVYTLEDGPVASQAGADPYVATHYRVNRGGHYGGMGKELKLAPNEVVNELLEIVPCFGCNADILYFNIIVWEKGEGKKYKYVNGKVFVP